MNLLNFHNKCLLGNSYQYTIWFFSPAGFHLKTLSNIFNVYSLITCIPVNTRTYLLLNYQQQKFVSKKNFLFEALDQLQENLPLLPVFGFLPIHSLCTAISLPGSENTNKANLILLIFFSFKNVSTLQFVTLCLQSFLFSFFYLNLKISSNQ